MLYEVKIRSNAVKKIESLPKSYISKIYNKIFSLSENPRPQGCKKLKGFTNL